MAGRLAVPSLYMLGSMVGRREKPNARLEGELLAYR
jgi:hypothetical protein